MTDTTPFHPLASSTDWQTALERSSSEPVLIFKHSSACPTSARANEEMETLTESGDLPIYRVVVQESREVSDRIADELGIRHESPQAILLVDGAPAFDASHHRVKADTVREALEESA